jgi:hypothetical protein
MAVEMMQCDSIIDRIDPLSDDIEISDYVKKLPLEARKRYVVKLLYNYGRCMLPDPYLIKSTWNDDPSLWPHIEFGHVYCYLIDTPGIFTKESLKAYKSLDAYRFVNYRCLKDSGYDYLKNRPCYHWHWQKKFRSTDQ